jgi:hypothetical protein
MKPAILTGSRFFYGGSMTQEEEEEALFQKVVKLKRERDFLYVIYEELDELTQKRYDGPFVGEETRGLIFALQEYKNWKEKLEE